MYLLVPVAFLVVGALALAPAYQMVGMGTTNDNTGMVIRSDIKNTKMFTQISDYYPKNPYINLPCEIRMSGQEGETGHISYGVIVAEETPKRIVSAGIELTIDKADFRVDAGLTRMALATQWDAGDGAYYYVEFDFWTCPGYDGLIDLIKYTGLSGEVAEVKMADAGVGQHVDLKVPAQDAFDRYFPNIDATLHCVYLVIEKNDAQSMFSIEVTLEAFYLYSEEV